MLLIASLVVLIAVLVASVLLISSPPRWLRRRWRLPVVLLGALVYMWAGVTLVMQAWWVK